MKVSTINIKGFLPLLAAGLGGSSILGTIGAGLASAAPYIGSAVAGVGSAYAANKLIGEPNARDAYNRSFEGSAYALERNYDIYKRRYQDTMSDMRSAGLNPILAVSKGFNVSGQPTMVAPQAVQPHTPQDYMSGSAKNYAGVAKTFKELTLVSRQAEESMAKAQKLRAEKGLVSKQEKVAQQEYWVKLQEFNKVSAEAYKNMSQHALNVEQKGVIKAKAQSLIYALKRLENYNKIYSSPGGYNMQWIQEVLKTLAVPITGLIGAGVKRSITETYGEHIRRTE